MLKQIIDIILYFLTSWFKKPSDYEIGYDTPVSSQSTIGQEYEIDINQLQIITQQHHQFSDSNLVKALQTFFTLEDARYCAKRSCKCLTFWIEATMKGLMSKSYIEYYEMLIDNKYVDPIRNAYLKLDLDQLGTVFGITVTTIKDIEVLKNYKSNEFWYGTLRFRPNGGWHSMLIFNIPNEGLKVADTANRKFGSDVFKYLNKQNFEYLTILS